MPTQLPTQSDEPIQRLLLALTDEEKSTGALRSALGIKHRPNFRDNYLHPALDAELIEMTIPEKLSSSKQKYRLTAKGKDFLTRETKGGEELAHCGIYTILHPFTIYGCRIQDKTNRKGSIGIQAP